MTEQSDKEIEIQRLVQRRQQGETIPVKIIDGLLYDKIYYSGGEQTEILVKDYTELLTKGFVAPIHGADSKKFQSQQKKKLNAQKRRNQELLNIFQIDKYQYNVEQFHEINPFFYDKSKIFWFWNIEENKYEIVDETDLMLFLDEHLGFHGQTVGNSVKSNYLEAFRRVGRKNKPKEAKLKWVQFKDKAFSLSGKVHQVTPDYFFTNPIPWEIGQDSKTPTMDKLFKDWVGDKYVNTLYEIIAYCCYRGYPIQLLFSLCGSGRNGKSQYLKIIDKFIGIENTVSTELDRLLENRFESFKLYKKLVCLIGETNFSVLEQSSILKKLTGGDKIGFEKKNKDPFDDYNYAKPIIASNSLPSSNDTSEGFYRRWLIIDFPNEFEESGRDIVDEIPEHEYNALAKKVTEILPNLLKKGKFTNQGTIVERKNKYIEQSNPLQKFLKQYCQRGEDKGILYTRLYTHYIQFLQKNKRRKVKTREFKSALEDEGLFVEKTWFKEKNGFFVLGVDIVTNVTIVTTTPVKIPMRTKLNEKDVTNVTNVTENYINTVQRYININQEDKDLKFHAEQMFGEEIIQSLLRDGYIMEDVAGHLKNLN